MSASAMQGGHNEWKETLRGTIYTTNGRYTAIHSHGRLGV